MTGSGSPAPQSRRSLEGVGPAAGDRLGDAVQGEADPGEPGVGVSGDLMVGGAGPPGAGPVVLHLVRDLKGQVNREPDGMTFDHVASHPGCFTDRIGSEAGQHPQHQPPHHLQGQHRLRQGTPGPDLAGNLHP